MNIKRKQKQGGFALLLTLVLVMIAGVALTMGARESATEALASREAAEALQRRWAVTSCRATLLPRVQRLLDDADIRAADQSDLSQRTGTQTDRSADVWLRCTLAGIDYDLVLTDEQAKYNPTVMRATAKHGRVEPALRRLVAQRAQPKREQAIALRPLIGLNHDGTPVKNAKSEPRTQTIPTLYAAYGQVFADASPQVLLGSADAPGPAAYVTCWGDGRLNLERAPAVVVGQAMLPLLESQGVKELLKARDELQIRGSADSLRQVVSAPPIGKARASRLLTQSSRCQGLWVVARGRTRSWYTFSVLEYRPPTLDAMPGPSRLSAPIDQPQRTKTNNNDESAASTLRRYDYAW